MPCQHGRSAEAGAIIAGREKQAGGLKLCDHIVSGMRLPVSLAPSDRIENDAVPRQAEVLRFDVEPSVSRLCE